MPAHTLNIMRGVVCAVLLATLYTDVASADASRPAPNRRLEDTAYTLRAGRFSVGVWSAEAGLLDGVTIGTYLPAWLAFPVVDSPIFTGFMKIQAPFGGPLALSIRAGAAYFDASQLAAKVSDGRATRANVFAVPIELAASLRLSERVTQSLALHYVTFKVGASDGDVASGSGSARSQHANLSGLFEYQLSPLLALTLVGRLAVFQSVARINAQVTSGPTRLVADLGFQPYDGKLPFCVVPGIALRWSHVNLELGLGYGSYWLPIVQAPLPGTSIVPEGNLYVRF